MIMDPYVCVVVPADHVRGPAQGEWTYEDLFLLPEDGTSYEIIAGVLYTVPPTLTVHQVVRGIMLTHLMNYIGFAGRGRVIGTPFDVCLSNVNVVRPDVSVVLNEHHDRLSHYSVMGAPDLVVEITSPNTATYDRSTKFMAYERGGVPEYWMADPFAHVIEVWVLADGRYVSRGVFEDKALLPSVIVPNFPIAVEEFFVDTLFLACSGSV